MLKASEARARAAKVQKKTLEEVLDIYSSSITRVSKRGKYYTLVPIYDMVDTGLTDVIEALEEQGYEVEMKRDIILKISWEKPTDEES